MISIPRLLLPLTFSLFSVAALAESAWPLAGDWSFQLDRQDEGIGQRWFERDLADRIALPGTTDLAKKGDRNDAKEAKRLTRRFTYYGAAWYQRMVEIPAWKGKRVTLTLERTKMTQVWLDGRDLGKQDSLVAPHVYDLGTAVEPGRHRLTIRVDNKNLPPIGDPHQISDQTQTNWNGILGRIELSATDPVWLDAVWAFPEPATQSIRIRATLGNLTGKPATGLLTIGASSFNGPRQHRPKPVTIDFSNLAAGQTVEAVLPLGPDALNWDEFSPALYRLEVKLRGQAGTTIFNDSRTIETGLRSFVAKGTQFQANGRTVFLRGKHDACVFPLTGHPPMDKEGWLKVMRISQSYGINHYRFHTWCPPDAAFAAADELGIYMQPELPNWRPFEKEDHNRYMLEEGKRLLAAFGNHPSFVMMALGNEMGDPRTAMAETVAALRAYDPRHLFAQGSNNFFWAPSQAAGDDYWTTMRTRKGDAMTRGSFSHSDLPLGRVQAGPANTLGDFSNAIAGVVIPVIGHETGQYQVFADLSEIPKYTGVLEARNFELIHDRLKSRGMLDQAADFTRASGKLTALCYREDNELAFRTRGFAGFQILDLQDFPGQGTALVGVLNAFMESKGVVTPEEWRESCAPTVIFARFPTYTWTSDQAFSATVEVAHYGAAALTKAAATWTLRNAAGKALADGKLPAVDIPQGSLTSLGSLSIPLAKVKAPARLTLELKLKGAAVHHYPLWVYPAPAAAPAGVRIAHRFDPATRAALNEGASILLMPAADTLAGISVPGFFAPDFWCWPMFHNLPGTMGLLMNPKHPALAGFPTDFHSDWQWFDIAMASRPVILDELPAGSRPIVQVIDNFDRCHRLGLVSEFTCGKGRLLLVACDLAALQDKPAARQLLASLASYVNSEKFKPVQPLPSALAEALSQTDVAQGKPATASSSQSETYAPGKAVDGNADSRWCAADAATGYWWQVDLGQPRALSGGQIAWEFSGRYCYLVEGSADGQAWTVLSDQRQRQDRNQTHALKFTAKDIRHVRITVTGLDNNRWASIREVKLFGAE